jgi:hypothetical protein
MLDSTARLILSTPAALVLLCDAAVALWLMAVTEPARGHDQDINSTGWN